MAAKKKEAVAEEAKQVTQEAIQQDAPEIQSELGGALKRAREAQKLTLSDVCARLHLNEKHVIAMEQDDFVAFDDQTRARAFIRTYARLLGLDEESLISKHRQLFPAEALNPIGVSTETLANSAKPQGIPRYFLVLGALVLITLFVWFLSALNFGGASAPKVNEPEVAQEVLPEATPSPADQTQNESANTTVSEIQLPQQATAAAAAPQAVAEPAKAAEVKPAANLKIVASENAWVGVKDAAGKDILSKVVKAGSEEVVQGVPPLKLHVGNAKGIQVVYNGQPIDYSAKTFNNTARVTLGAE